MGFNKWQSSKATKRSAGNNDAQTGTRPLNMYISSDLSAEGIDFETSLYPVETTERKQLLQTQKEINKVFNKEVVKKWRMSGNSFMSMILTQTPK